MPFSKISGRGAIGFRVVMCLAIQFPPHNRCKHEGKRKMSAKGDEHVRHSRLGAPLRGKTIMGPVGAAAR